MSAWWYPLLRPFWPRQYAASLAVRAGAAPGIWHAENAGDRVAITFDDGPSPGAGERILDALRSGDARATFFLIGKNVEAHPELARRLVAEGHEAAHHTQTHPRLGLADHVLVQEELEACAKSLARHLPEVSSWFRPPYGSLRLDQMTLPGILDLVPAYWSVNSKDWKLRDAREIAARVLSGVKPGSVILLHDWAPETAEAMPLILEGLKKRGLRSVTLSELFPR
jgi:peptidoglycan/xylan/chitin deacetylase (PgdA/CDA1 family)